jgi:hypothetical protein
MGHPGLAVTARVLPLAALVFSRYSEQELARHRGTFADLAHDVEVPDEDVGDSLTEGLQGLGGLTILGGVFGAFFLWLSQRTAYVPLSVLASVSMGVMGFGGGLGAIHGARLVWPWPALRPRRADFWVAVAVALLTTAFVLGGRLNA